MWQIYFKRNSCKQLETLGLFDKFTSLKLYDFFIEED